MAYEKAVDVVRGRSMMGIFDFLFGKKGASKPNFRRVDWAAIDGKLRELELLFAVNDQSSSKNLIMTADSLVDRIMKEAGVPGATMGDRLKYMQNLLDRAVLNRLWAAHKKRNELAHHSESFVADWEKQAFWTAFKEGIRAMRLLK